MRADKDQVIRFRMADLSDLAYRRYHARYDNRLYLKATEGRSSRRANKLIDDAMAICGYPHYRLSRMDWSEDELAFLRLFATEYPR